MTKPNECLWCLSKHLEKSSGFIDLSPNDTPRICELDYYICLDCKAKFIENEKFVAWFKKVNENKVARI